MSNKFQSSDWTMEIFPSEAKVELDFDLLVSFCDGAPASSSNRSSKALKWTVSNLSFNQTHRFYQSILQWSPNRAEHRWKPLVCNVSSGLFLQLFTLSQICIVDWIDNPHCLCGSASGVLRPPMQFNSSARLLQRGAFSKWVAMLNCL